MIVAIFRSRIKKEFEQEYYQRAEVMAEIATKMPGFISYKTYTSPDGERVSIHEWESAECLKSWSNHPKHLEMKKWGQDNLYYEYTLYLCDSPRETHFNEEDRAT